MKGATGFLLGVAVGAFGVLALQRLLEQASPEDAEDLTDKLNMHLAELEVRLEKAMHAAEGIMPTP